MAGSTKTGTVIITGANSSVGIPAVQYLLEKFPAVTAILTVRDASDADPNTARLRSGLSRHPQAKTTVLELDMSRLSSVHDFSRTLSRRIRDGEYPPIVSVVCNAFSWNLVDGPAELTPDGYEKAFQVNHVSHAALVLRLLGDFDGARGGRVVTLGTAAHEPGKALWEKVPPEIPGDLDQLVKPPEHADYTGRPFQRYANSKLAIITWTHALARHLAEDPELNKINAVSVDPGNLVDSRALSTNTPLSFSRAQTFLLKPLKSVLGFLDPSFRQSADVAPELIGLALQEAFPGDSGYFRLSNKEDSSPDSRDVEVQDALWAKTLEWAGVAFGKSANEGN